MQDPGARGDEGEQGMVRVPSRQRRLDEFPITAPRGIPYSHVGLPSPMNQLNTTNWVRAGANCLLICQQNVNKSLVAQGDLLNQLNPDNCNIAAIQEPYLDANHNSRAMHHMHH